jgi:two-component system, OmpR family, phosphate regulon response regulator PhoB
MSSAKPKILVVEDEGDIRELMSLHLKRDGFAPDHAADGEEALQRIRENSYQLYVFDWMLPGLSGLDLTRVVLERRKSGEEPRSVPILMVTARVEAADIVRGLEAGADDYVTKPFEVPVFLARVRALIRRYSHEAVGGEGKTGTLIDIGGLRVDKTGHRVECAGEPVALTLSEYKLLLALAENRGRVLTRARLIDLVQGSDVSVVDRTIDTHVFGLRKKLGECGDTIETVRGVGYRMKN